MSQTADLRRRLEVGVPLEDIVHEYLQQSHASDSDDARAFAEAVLEQIVNHDDWRDATRAVATLLYAIDAATQHELADGDTRTLLLAKAIAVDPDRDDLAAAYLTAVVDGDYRHERGLSRALARASKPRRAWLASVDTFAEYRIVVAYLGQAPYDASLRQAFKTARDLGVDEAAWAACRAWALAQVPQLEVPADLWARYG